MNRWIEAADFVGYIVFFVAIFFVMHAFYIMFLSITMCRRYVDLDQASISDILIDFERARKKKWIKFLMNFRLIPLLKVLKNVEFKIGWAVFRDTYVLPSQFSYVEYVSGCLQRYALRLVDIKMTSWLFLMALAMINYIRMITVDRDCKNGFSKEDRDQNEKLREQFEDCEKDHKTMFLICGGVLLVYVVGLFIGGRVYQFRIIGRAGVLCVDDYADFLIFEEAHLVQADRKKLETKPETGGRKRKSSVVVFKNAMHGFLQKQQRLESARKKLRLHKVIRNNILSKKFLSRRRIEPTSTSSHTTSDSSFVAESGDIDNSDSNMESKSKGKFSFFNSRIAHAKSDEDIKESVAFRNIISSWQSPARRFYMKVKERRQPMSARLDNVRRGEKRIKFSEDLSDIFFLGRPQLFFQAVEISILMNSLFLSVWFCNYMTRMNDKLNVSYLMLFPIIVCFPIIGEIVKIASMIDCTAKLNLDVVGQILEDIEERTQLKNDIQERLKLLPMNEDTCMATVNKLFSDLASPDNPDEIGEEDFREILKSLKIYFR